MTRRTHKPRRKDYDRAVRLCLRQHLDCSWYGGEYFSIDDPDTGSSFYTASLHNPRKGYAAVRRWLKRGNR